MKRLTFIGFVVGLMALAAPSIAQAPIVVELEGIFGGSPGTVRLIESVSVDPALVGATCTGTGQVANNISVHPDNDVILSSGDSSAEITDYESVPGAVIPMDNVLTPAPGDGALTLGETIDFSVRFGPDGITSAGLTVVLDCAQPPPTTTTTTTTTTTAPPVTTTTTPPETTTTTTPPETTTTTTPPETTTTTAPPETTTTSPPPLGGAGAGGGGTADNDALGWYALGAAGIVLAGAGATTAWRMRGQW